MPVLGLKDLLSVLAESLLWGLDHSSDILQQQYFPTGLVRMSQEMDPGRHRCSFSLGSGSGRPLMSLHSSEHTWLVGIMGGGWWL